MRYTSLRVNVPPTPKKRVAHVDMYSACLPLLNLKIPSVETRKEFLENNFAIFRRAFLLFPNILDFLPFPEKGSFELYYKPSGLTVSGKVIGQNLSHIQTNYSTRKLLISERRQKISRCYHSE